MSHGRCGRWGQSPFLGEADGVDCSAEYLPRTPRSAFLGPRCNYPLADEGGDFFDLLYVMQLDRVVHHVS